MKICAIGAIHSLWLSCVSVHSSVSSVVLKPSTHHCLRSSAQESTFASRSPSFSANMAEEFDVQLWRYDISRGLARSMSMMLLGEQLEGIWHTSVVVYGKEFFFDGGVGIEIVVTPGTSMFGRPHSSEPIGRTSKSLEEFLLWVSHQKGCGFGPNDYQILRNNCNHFTQAAVQFLVGASIPADVREMIPRILSTPLGAFLAPLLNRTGHGGAGDSNARSPMPMSTSGVPLQRLQQPDHKPAGFLSDKKALDEDEEEDLLTAKAIFESCDAPPADSPTALNFLKIEALTTLTNLFETALTDPTSPAGRCLSTNSSDYRDMIAPFEEYEILTFLRLTGYRLAMSQNEPQWVLADNRASANIIQQVKLELETLCAVIRLTIEKHASLLRSNIDLPHTDPPFRYCSPPFNSDYIPLKMDSTPHSNHVNHASFFSILYVGGGEENHCFGRCRFSTDLAHVEAWACVRDQVQEVPAGSYTVLCVRKGCEDRVAWIPAAAATEKLVETGGRGASSFIFHPTEFFGVVRAVRYGKAYPGYMMASGECCIPYRGAVEDVTLEAQVLCDRTRVPESIMKRIDALTTGSEMLNKIVASSGTFMSNLDELCEWQGKRSATVSNLYPLRTRLREAPHAVPNRPKVLVCYDDHNSYRRYDYSSYGSTVRIDSPLEMIQLWHLVDYVAYTSHHRISVPPHEVVARGHKNGTAVLGSVLLASDASGELDFLLRNPQRMAAVITALVSLCDCYGFDGFLIQCEVGCEENLTKRLVAFCNLLRRCIQAADHDSRLVIWQDSKHIQNSFGDSAERNNGHGYCNNALNAFNTPFFAVTDGIVLNYPESDSTLLRLCHDMTRERCHDCFMLLKPPTFSAPRANPYRQRGSVLEILSSSLSAAVSLSVWRAEGEFSGGCWPSSRAIPSASHASLPRRLLHRPSLEIQCFPQWTAFTEAVGDHFSINGQNVTHVPWCQPSGAHVLPACLPVEQEGSLSKVTLPALSLLSDGVDEWAAAPGQWIYHQDAAGESNSNVWFGNRSLEVELNAESAVQVVDWAIPMSSSSTRITVDLSLAFTDVPPESSPKIQVLLKRFDVNEASKKAGKEPLERFDEVRAISSSSASGYRVIRFSGPNAAYSGIYLNAATTVRCRVGGVAVLAEDTPSPLLCPPPLQWPHPRLHASLNTQEHVLVLPGVVSFLSGGKAQQKTFNVVLMAELFNTEGNGSPFTMFLGQHRIALEEVVEDQVWLPVCGIGSHVSVRSVSVFHLDGTT